VVICGQFVLIMIKRIFKAIVSVIVGDIIVKIFMNVGMLMNGKVSVLRIRFVLLVMIKCLVLLVIRLSLVRINVLMLRIIVLLRVMLW